MQSPSEQYVDLMLNARRRFDLIAALKASDADGFLKTETSAFHGRKIVEAIAFACLVATKNGIKVIPKDAEGQWNAEKIFRCLSKKQLGTFPSPSILRYATDEEKLQHGVMITVEGVADRRITTSEMIAVYQRLHKWLHELNPYVDADRAAFLTKFESQLWSDLAILRQFLERHFIAINGEGFYCTLWDATDGATKIQSLTKVAPS